jgi:hypothetical protein
MSAHSASAREDLRYGAHLDAAPALRCGAHFMATQFGPLTGALEITGVNRGLREPEKRQPAGATFNERSNGI